MSVVGLLEYGDVGTAPDGGSDPGAPVIHGLSTDRARREQPPDQRALVRQPDLFWGISILITDRLAEPTAHVIG
jgi:hypothetical protein